MDFSPDHVTQLTIVRPAAGKEQNLLDAMHKYAKEVEAQDPNTLSWHIIDIKEPGEDGGKEIAVLGRWKDEAACQAHYETPYFAELKQHMSDLRSPILTKNTTPMGGFMVRH